ncbi:MAG: EAL domain-containing protein [Cyanobacteria bacterium RI_101]|nr:EAL domain-containing protein [Cyanobacteria bacterium RI_101]
MTSSSLLAPEAPPNALAFLRRRLTEILQGRLKVFLPAPWASSGLKVLSLWQNRFPTSAKDWARTETFESPLLDLDLATELAAALATDSLTLAYQPQIDLRTGRLGGVEALVRWNHPQQGVISPAEFIPLAEATGLIVPLGDWVLRESCRQYRRWLNAGVAPFKLSVNISPRQLEEPDLGERLQAILVETGVAPEALTLEITESCMLDEPQTVIAHLTALRRLGVQIAIDDFGVGYSSLAFLKDLPVNLLKLDKAFLDGATPGSKNQVILAGIIELGHRLQLRLVAEGIENGEQLALLKKLHCDVGQGYLLSPPLSSQDMTRHFRQPQANPLQFSHSRLLVSAGAAVSP